MVHKSYITYKQQRNLFPHMPSSGPYGDGYFEETYNEGKLSIVLVQKNDNDKNAKTLCVYTITF
jgi:hypothetical protein